MIYPVSAQFHLNTMSIGGYGAGLQGKNDYARAEAEPSGGALGNGRQAPKPSEEKANETAASGETLTDQEKQQLNQLRAADRKVKAHEMAHLLAAGGYAQGGPSFQYRTGPDGEKYAVAGEVAIDVQKAPSPQETIEKMKTVRRAALAPADPSAQDRRIAARATRMIADANQLLRLEGLTTTEENSAKVQGTAQQESAHGGIDLYA